MQFLKRIKPTFLSFILIVCCLSFQADTFSSIAANTYTSWIVNSSDQSKVQDVYNIKLRKSETILGNNFSIFRFKCFLKQRKSLLATQYKQQQTLQLPQHPEFIKIIPQTLVSEDDTLIG